MSIRIKSKSYGPLTVTSHADDSIISITEGGHSVGVGLTAGPDSSSPSDLLLGALGSCIYISLGMAANALKHSVSDLTVCVTAEKAQSLPHRIDRFDVQVSFDFNGTAEERDRILKDTKALCTVSNTLNANVTLRYQASARSA